MTHLRLDLGVSSCYKDVISLIRFTVDEAEWLNVMLTMLRVNVQAYEICSWSEKALINLTYWL